MADDRGGGDFLAGFVIGGMVGAALALLFAPQRGEETRAQLRERGLELRSQADGIYDSAQELSDEAIRMAQEARERGKSALGETRVQAEAKLKEAVDEGKKAAEAKKRELLEKLDKERGKAEGQA